MRQNSAQASDKGYTIRHVLSEPCNNNSTLSSKKILSTAHMDLELMSDLKAAKKIDGGMYT